MNAEKTCERVTKSETRQDAEPEVCGNTPANFWAHFGLVLCHACGTKMVEAVEASPFGDRYFR
ncbi:hypothetical protein LCGC14_1262660 [marine sediment metagenome]|uniref:Uncharacterized protein n=1 Tax=marine sediment metagenome TaxID=412755 RepID=A0A0F9L2H9_9ZZZZ